MGSKGEHKRLVPFHRGVFAGRRKCQVTPNCQRRAERCGVLASGMASHPEGAESGFDGGHPGRIRYSDLRRGARYLWVPDKPNDPIDLVLQPAPGEPARFGLVSTDGATKVFGTIIPLPLRGEDRGCRIEAILLTAGSELVLIEGSGFPPNSDLQMKSVSEGERHGNNGKADANGKYTTAILPYKQGVTHGVAVVDLRTSVCAPSVEFRWGRRS